MSSELLALLSLAKDFEHNHKYYHLRNIRNRITHSFININTEIFYNNTYSSYEITEPMLRKATERMFLIVKSALMYTVNALNLQITDDHTMRMNTTHEKDIF